MDQERDIFLTSNSNKRVEKYEDDRNAGNTVQTLNIRGLGWIAEGTTTTAIATPALSVLSPLSSPPLTPSLFGVGNRLQVDPSSVSPVRMHDRTISSPSRATPPHRTILLSSIDQDDAHAHHEASRRQQQQQKQQQFQDGISRMRQNQNLHSYQSSPSSPSFYGLSNNFSPLMHEVPQQSPSSPSSPPREIYQQTKKRGDGNDQDCDGLPSSSSPPLSSSPTHQKQTENSNKEYVPVRSGQVLQSPRLGDISGSTEQNHNRGNFFQSFLPSRFTSHSSSKDLANGEEPSNTEQSEKDTLPSSSPNVSSLPDKKGKVFYSPSLSKDKRSTATSLPMPPTSNKNNRQTTADSRVTFHPDDWSSLPNNDHHHEHWGAAATAEGATHTVTSTSAQKKEIIVSYQDDASKLQEIFQKLHNRQMDGTKTWYEITRLLEHFHKDDPKRCRRSCERQRDITERTYLHAVLMNNPPVQIVRLLIKLSSATLQLVDFYGMTPLHMATNYTSSYEVQECLVKEYPEALTISDSFGRVPLHYVFDPLKLDEALARAQKNQIRLQMINTGTLGSGPETDDHDDEDGFGFDDEEDDDRSAALDASRPSLSSPRRGTTAAGGLTIKAARRLVGRQRGYYARVALLTDSEAVLLKDCHGKSPFRLYCRIAKSVRQNDEVFMDRMRRILLLLLDSDPLDSHEELIVELRHLPYQLLDVAIKHPLTHGVVNAKTSHSIFASLFLLDLTVQIILIIGFTYVVTAVTWVNKGDEYVPPPSGEEETRWQLKPLEAKAIVLLCVGLGISILRQGLEIAASIGRSNFRRWISDFWNLLSVFNVWLVLASTTQLVQQRLVVSKDKTYYLTLVAGGVQWVSLLTILRLAWMPFSIFVTGTLRVAAGLLPYAIVSFFLMGAYAFMFYVGTIDECNKAGIKLGENTRVNGEFTCTFRGSLLTMFDWRFGSGIPREAFYSFSSDITILTIVFTIFFMILMAHVLIAVVVDQYFNAKESGIQMFWRFRFEGLANAEAIRTMTRRMTIGFGKGRLGNSSSKELLEVWWDSAVWTLSSHLVVSNPNNKKRSKKWKASSSKNLNSSFSPSSGAGVSKHTSYTTNTAGKYYRAKIWHALKKVLVLLGMAIWCILGLVTLGVLWPPQVIDYLFCPACTSQDYQTAATQKKAQEKQKEKELEQFELLRKRMEHIEDQSEELRAIQLRLQKDLRDVRKSFEGEMKYVSTQMSNIQESVNKVSKVILENNNKLRF